MSNSALQPTSVVDVGARAVPLVRPSASARTTAVGSDAPSDRFDERALVESARTDPDAFAELYRMYVERIHDYAFRRTGSRAVAEDVTSATFEKALRGLTRYRWREPGIGPWLFRIAANELTDTHRRRGRQHKVTRRLASVAPDTDPGDFAARLEEASELRDALDAIPPRYQRALSLRYLAELTNEEAAIAMGLSRRTMAVLVHRALAALRRAMEDQRSQGTTHAD